MYLCLTVQASLCSSQNSYLREFAVFLSILTEHCVQFIRLVTKIEIDFAEQCCSRIIQGYARANTRRRIKRIFKLCSFNLFNTIDEQKNTFRSSLYRQA